MNDEINNAMVKLNIIWKVWNIIKLDMHYFPSLESCTHAGCIKNSSVQSFECEIES